MRAAPDSVAARLVRARDLTRRAPATPEAVAAWLAVLELQPHSLEALLGSGKELASRHDFARATAQLEHALELDPKHRIARRNLALMELRSGRGDAAARRVEDLLADGLLRQEEIESWCAQRLQALDLPAALALFPALVPPPPWNGQGGTQALFDCSRALEASRPSLSRALEGWCHAAWGNQHALEGRYEDAVRSYRQARSLLSYRADGSDTAPLVTSNALLLEAAAALALAGQSAAAQAEIERLRVWPDEIVRLPTWAGEALKPLGLFERLEADRSAD